MVKTNMICEWVAGGKQFWGTPTLKPSHAFELYHYLLTQLTFSLKLPLIFSSGQRGTF